MDRAKEENDGNDTAWAKTTQVKGGEKEV